MIRNVTLPSVVVLVLTAAALTAQEKPAPDAATRLTDRPKEERAVRELLKGFVASYNAAKAADVAALFADDGTVVDGAGDAVRGRAAIAEHYETSFAAGPVAQLSGAIQNLRFLTPDVAQVEGEFALHEGPPESSPVLQSGRYALLAVRRETQWRIAEVRDYPNPAPSRKATTSSSASSNGWSATGWTRAKTSKARPR